MPNRIIMIAAAAAAFAPVAAQADELQGKLLAAIRASRGDLYSFQRTIAIERTGTPRQVFVERYDPRRPAAERWSLITVDGHAPTAKDIAQSRKAKRGPVPSYGELAEWFGAPATRTDTASGHVLYRFARLPAGVLKIGSHDASADTQAEALVNVKGKTPFVERIRFFSNKGFRMMLVASVKNMDVTRRYTSLPSGAMVPDAGASTMTGSMMGKDGQIKTAVNYEGFQAVK